MYSLPTCLHYLAHTLPVHTTTPLAVLHRKTRFRNPHLSTPTRAQMPPTPATKSSEPDMTDDIVYETTNGKYTTISPAGSGTCGILPLCIATPSPPSNMLETAPQNPLQLVVLKIPQATRRQRLGTEIRAVERIHSFSSSSSDILQHFPALLDFNPVIPTEGSKWAALSPIHGFSLNQLLATIQQNIFFGDVGGERYPGRWS
jgi:hypothetical protein